MNTELIRRALEIGLDNTNSLGNVTGNDYQSQMEEIVAALAEIAKPAKPNAAPTPACPRCETAVNVVPKFDYHQCMVCHKVF